MSKKPLQKGALSWWRNTMPGSAPRCRKLWAIRGLEYLTNRLRRTLLNGGLPHFAKNKDNSFPHVKIEIGTPNWSYNVRHDRPVHLQKVQSAPVPPGSSASHGFHA